jgi:Cu/Ag efflux protein CusF
MKRMTAVLLALFLMNPVFGQTVHRATGVVTKVEPATGRITIKHDPVKSLNWPGMTMVFKAKDKAVLDKVKKDQKIDFGFVEQGKDYVVTDVK